MNRLVSSFSRWSTPRYALLALLLFLVNVIALNFLDRPLFELAGGEPKLDLRLGYDLDTVRMLFEAYGAQGRGIYVWNLLVDTPFPLLGAVATILFAYLASDNLTWRRWALIAPLTFAVTDIIENVLLLVLVNGYPELSQGLVSVTSGVTVVKRTAFYTGAVELIVSSGVLLYRRFRRFSHRSTLRK